MRILWFSPTPSLFTSKRWGHNGGGWISSLQNIIQPDNNIDLGVAFEYAGNADNEMIDNVMYYPISTSFGISEKLQSVKKHNKQINRSLQIIDDFKPDIIQLFGSESWYGLLANHTTTPIVIHMQGSLPSYYNARYPVGMSVWNKILSSKTTLKQKLFAFRIDSTFHKKALQEKEILKANLYFMGRTHWDKAIVQFYNPTANYFVCQEALRDSFTSASDKWQFKERNKIKLVSVISGPLYKGVDVVLKTAKLLKENTSLDFEWNVCGTDKIGFFENTYKIKSKDVNVRMLGILGQEDLYKQLMDSTFYIHPSYIDNSPNSICEAQILGLPIIATNVGGVSSLITDHETGFLVPANDPLMIASIIVKYRDDNIVLQKISEAGVKVATYRHNPEKIKHELLAIYNQIVNNHISNDN